VWYPNPEVVIWTALLPLMQVCAVAPLGTASQPAPRSTARATFIPVPSRDLRPPPSIASRRAFLPCSAGILPLAPSVQLRGRPGETGRERRSAAHCGDGRDGTWPASAIGEEVDSSPEPREKLLLLNLGQGPCLEPPVPARSRNPPVGGLRGGSTPLLDTGLFPSSEGGKVVITSAIK
jgi:hypothetical protein